VRGPIDIDQLQPPQRTFGRERVPGRFIEQLETERRRGMRDAWIAVSSRAQAWDADVVFRRRAQQQDTLFKFGQLAARRQDFQSRQLVRIVADVERRIGANRTISATGQIAKALP
jgi:hypothetical protein